MIISVIIPSKCFCEIYPCLQSIRRECPLFQNDIEVIWVMGNQPSMQRNVAAKKSHGEILLFLDNDSEIQEGYFNHLLDLFRLYDNVEVIGGPCLLYHDNPIAKYIHFLKTSFWGCLHTISRHKAFGNVRKAHENNLILCNVAIKRNTFLLYNGFNEALYPCEENDLFDRFVHSNIMMLYDPELIVKKPAVSELSEFIKKTFFQSFYRSLYIKKFAKLKCIHLFYMLPVFTVFISILSMYFYPYLFLLVFFILSIFIMLSISISTNKKISELNPCLCYFYILINLVTYSMGFSYGLFINNLNSHKERYADCFFLKTLKNKI